MLNPKSKRDSRKNYPGYAVEKGENDYVGSKCSKQRLASPPMREKISQIFTKKIKLSFKVKLLQFKSVQGDKVTQET